MGRGFFVCDRRDAVEKDSCLLRFETAEGLFESFACLAQQRGQGAKVPCGVWGKAP